MKTYSVKPTDIKKEWVIVDAAGQTLGRLASEVAGVLRGKHKPTFVPYLDCGDNVIIINAKDVVLTGNKLTKKVYYHHTGYMGGIKGIKAGELLAKKPESLIEIAIKGMLPKTKLGRTMATNFRVYAGSDHTQKAQAPKPMTPRTAKI